MKKLLILFSLLTFLIIGCGNSAESGNKTNEKTGNSKKFKIGITQIASHPALDNARKGFEDAFKEAGVDADFDEKNANGETANANLIANNFASSKVDLIYAIATSTAQTAVQSTNSIPIVFAAITDPKSAGTLKPNVTGVSDRMDVSEQMKLLKRLDDKIKSVGVIYNSSEPNSKVQVEDLKKAAAPLGLTVVEKSVTQANEIPQTVDNLTREADAIYLPTDNLVASVANLITEKAASAKKIVFGAEAAHVEKGALITQGVSYYEIGKEAGKMAIEILKNGKKPSEIQFKQMPLSEIVINEKTLAALNINLPQDIKSKAKMVK